jgi:putative sigma-54 modulation protein
MTGLKRTSPGKTNRQVPGARCENRNQKETAVLVTISSRHMDVTEALKSYAEQKSNKLTKYYDRIQEIEVVFDAGKDKTSVEMIVNAEHRNMFLAHHNEGDAYACIDACVDKLERQLSDHKKKIRNRKHNAEDKHTML